MIVRVDRHYSQTVPADGLMLTRARYQLGLETADSGVFRYRVDDKAHVGQGLTIVGHAASPAATLVRIAYADGAHQDISLVQGWFMFDVPALHTTRAAAPTRMDVIGANGTWDQ